MARLFLEGSFLWHCCSRFLGDHHFPCFRLDLCVFRVGCAYKHANTSEQKNRLDQHTQTLVCGCVIITNLKWFKSIIFGISTWFLKYTFLRFRKFIIMKTIGCGAMANATISATDKTSRGFWEKRVHPLIQENQIVRVHSLPCSNSNFLRNIKTYPRKTWMVSPKRKSRIG